ncbi:transglycosylase [Marinicauda salina]|uniref:Transglycosylase n=1 Tax=Marinicauda salina TaxID=2135793 RepID=A0A2U2BV94_9PROT|nr:lytic transglycosylase domain-containing protein [Marinicauda salina]PWE17951.1 transglycosylase [Marinicauda salina]
MLHRAAALLAAFAALTSAALAQAPTPRIKPPVPNHSEILDDADFRVFRHGMRAAEDGEWSTVRGAMDSLTHPVARKVLQWRMATSDPRATFSELDRAVAALEGWPRASAVQREAEWKIDESGMGPAMIVAWFEDREPVTGEGRVELGEALIALDRVEEGHAEIREAWRSQSMRLSVQRDVLRRHGDLFSRADHAERVDFLIWSGQRAAASRLLPQLDRGDRDLAEARIQLAARGPGVDRAVNQVPDHLAAHPGLVYERARWRRRAGLDTALPLLLELPSGHQSEGVLEAMWTERKLMILDLLRDRDYQTAYELAAANGMSSGVDFADAEFLAGWLALTHLGLPEEALDHFARLEAGVSTPVSLARAKYWQGRAAEAMGDLDHARDRFAAAAQHATAYYGQLAMLALGPDSAELELPPEPEISDEQRAAFNARERIQALRLIGELDEDYYFRVFIYHLDDEMETETDQAMLADIATEYLRTRQAVRAAKTARMQGVTLAERAYPVIELPDNAPVFPEAALTHSVIRQETEFDPQAVSPAGARGLMQMMPWTARDTARDIGAPYNFRWLTDDPDYNLTLGMAHLDEVVEEYDGALVIALAAYNAGPTRARRWIRVYGDPRTGEVDPIDWVESIPFSETRNYVQRVIENLQVYRARMNDGASPGPLQMDRDMAGASPFARDLPGLPEDFLAAVREAEAAARAGEAGDGMNGMGGPLEAPAAGGDGASEAEPNATEGAPLLSAPLDDEAASASRPEGAQQAAADDAARD